MRLAAIVGHHEDLSAPAVHDAIANSEAAVINLGPHTNLAADLNPEHAGPAGAVTTDAVMKCPRFPGHLT
jgi:hypothetical protein